jgi:hypothetical protein
MPYPYEPTRRVITIEFRPSPGGGGEQEILVTPTHAEVRSRDTIVWDIQGAPDGVDVTVGNFQFKGATKVVSFSHSGSVTITPAPLLEGLHVDLTKPGQTVLSTATAHCAIGVYRYEFFVNGVSVIDPDVEIKPPRDC